MNLVNHKLFTKCSSPIFTDTLKMYLAYALTVYYYYSLSAKFSSPVAFTCMVHDHPCIVYCSSRVVACILKKISYVSESAGVIHTNTHCTQYTHIWYVYGAICSCLCDDDDVLQSQ